MSKHTINAPQTPLIGRMAYTNNTWRKCVIWTHHERGVGETCADVIGACGVHLVGLQWHVSHIPSGRVIVARENEADARAVAEALSTVALNTANVGRVRRLVAGVIGA